MGIWRWRLRRSLFRMVMTMARLLARVESGDSLLYPQVHGDSSSCWLGTKITQFVMFGIIMHVVNELHLSISNSTCTYFYNFSSLPGKTAQPSHPCSLGWRFCPKGDWERWISWKDLGGTGGAPQTSRWGSFPSCHGVENFTVGKFLCHWLMGWMMGVLKMPLNLAQGSLLFYTHVVFFWLLLGKLGRISSSDDFILWQLYAWLPQFLLATPGQRHACDIPCPLRVSHGTARLPAPRKPKKCCQNMLPMQPGFKTFMGFDGILQQRTSPEDVKAQHVFFFHWKASYFRR